MSFWAQAGSTEQRRAAGMKRYRWISIVSPRLRRGIIFAQRPARGKLQGGTTERGTDSACAMDCLCSARRDGIDCCSARLSRAPDPDHRSVDARGLARHHRPRRGARPAEHLVPAGGGREPARRQPEHRRRPGGEERARRLHMAARPRQRVFRQPASGQAAFRSAHRLRPRDRGGAHPVPAGRAALGASHFGAGAGRLCTLAPRRAELRLLRQRQPAAPGGDAVPDAYRHHDEPCAVQGCGTGSRRSASGAHPGVDRRGEYPPASYQGRQAAAPRQHGAATLSQPGRRADHRRSRRARLCPRSMAWAIHACPGFLGHHFESECGSRSDPQCPGIKIAARVAGHRDRHQLAGGICALHPRGQCEVGQADPRGRNKGGMSMANEVRRDLPVASPPPKELWGSDAVAAMLRALDIPYIALNPGASFRGLHDSIVNYLGNERPQMLLCLHEESAVAIAHGYAKASGRMMGVALHSNVGLMHASMAIFNAWCDRVPMLVLGATGPWDAAKRRPWIDWIHTASDQAALVRGYTKWDNQPGSVAAAQEALLRAAQLASTAPRGPTYINLDAALQESKLDFLPALPDVGRYS